MPHVRQRAARLPHPLGCQRSVDRVAPLFFVASSLVRYSRPTGPSGQLRHSLTGEPLASPAAHSVRSNPPGIVCTAAAPQRG